MAFVRFAGVFRPKRSILANCFLGAIDETLASRVNADPYGIFRDRMVFMNPIALTITNTGIIQLPNFVYIVVD